MWAEACELIARAERLHRQFFRPTAQPLRHPAWEPPFDMYETAEALWLVVALPGVPPERLEIRLDSAALAIAGVRPLPEFQRSAVLHRLEIPHGRFERRIELPAGHFELERHELVNGCLILALRKR
jgi:HSP20 family molecular chaperone IbpA